VAEVRGGEPQAEVILLGGIYYPRTALTMGPQSEREIRELSPRFLFMGVGGVGKDGFTNSNPQLVRAERTMMEVAEKTVILADSSKFGRRAMARLAGLGEADVLVTDAGAAPRDLDMVRKAGPAVRVAGHAGRRN
jgi:DeoR family transcriptional regulator of aga operon